MEDTTTATEYAAYITTLAASSLSEAVEDLESVLLGGNFSTATAAFNFVDDLPLDSDLRHAALNIICFADYAELRQQPTYV